jgi:hypothetical protein
MLFVVPIPDFLVKEKIGPIFIGKGRAGGMVWYGHILPRLTRKNKIAG